MSAALIALLVSLGLLNCGIAVGNPGNVTQVCE